MAASDWDIQERQELLGLLQQLKLSVPESCPNCNMEVSAASLKLRHEKPTLLELICRECTQPVVTVESCG